MALRFPGWLVSAGWFFCGVGFAQKGVVVDEASGKPIAKALVMQKPSWAFVLTNDKGEFEFPVSPVRTVQDRALRQKLRLAPDGTLRFASPFPQGRPQALRLFTPQGSTYVLPLSPDGTAQLPLQVAATQLLFLQAGPITYRLVRLNGVGFIQGEVAGPALPPKAALAKASAVADTLIVSRYGYDARTQLINGQDQGTIKLHANAKAPPPGMIELKGAAFTMGSRRDAVASPEHAVTVSGFYMDTVEVTQADYQLLMGNEFMSRDPHGYDINYGPQYAALNMTWYEAVLYCNARSKRDGLDTAFTYTGRTSLPSGKFNLDNFKINLNAKGYRLATEAEWEYGCKGGQDSDYFWGTNRANSDSAKAYAWYGDNSDIFGGTPTNCPVARKKKNPFGIYDIVGNAQEYVLDSRVSPYPTSPNLDPFFQDTQQPPSRIDRGGGWALPLNALQCTTRGSTEPNNSAAIEGIRVVLPIR